MPIRYVNGCTSCRYLGRSGKYDLYVCVSSAPTVIARFGNKPEQFKSSLVDRVYDVEFLEAGRSELIEAAILARKQGLLG